MVDTTSSNKYLMTRPAEQSGEVAESSEDLSFGDRAMSIGVGILNRLKARLNLEEVSETLKEKKEQYLGKKEEEKEKDGGG